MARTPFPVLLMSKSCMWPYILYMALQNTLSYGIEPNRLPFSQQSTEIPDGTGVVVVIPHRTAVGVRHGAQP
jgi:hypothetical protein